MDIRRFLTKAGPCANHRDTEEKKSPGGGKTAGKKRRIVDSDSDFENDEDPIPPKLRSEGKKRESPRKKKEEVASLTPVSISQYFSSSTAVPSCSPIKKSVNGKADTPKKIKEPSRCSPRKPIASVADVSCPSSAKKHVIKKEKEQGETLKPEPTLRSSPRKAAVVMSTQLSPQPQKAKVEESPARAEGKGKKMKLEGSKEQEMEVDEETRRKKEEQRNSYLQYLHRGGPAHPGSKTIPEASSLFLFSSILASVYEASLLGEEGCLEGVTFVVTGVLDSLGREESEDLIKQYGGKVTHSVSKNTTYLLVGNDPGPKKIEKAEKLGTKVLDEDGLLELIRTHPGKNKDTSTQNVDKKQYAKKTHEKHKLESKTEVPPVKRAKIEAPQMKESPKTPKEEPSISKAADSDISGETEMWRSGSFCDAGPWARGDDGAYHKAALLSGPPGVGKTTVALLACKELGFHAVELNASDTRSKRLLHDNLLEGLQNMSISSKGLWLDLRSGMTESHVLIMDEVDGMAGNEDRGGIAELISLIKTSRVPIICLANDRNHPKIRSLANHCYDLRFSKPRVEQIRGAMMSICFKEGLQVKPQALDEIILGTNQDLRQILHHLSLWSAGEKKSLFLEDVKAEANKSKKDLNHAMIDTIDGLFLSYQGPWDVVKSVFSPEEHKDKSINDKAALFFQDYSLGPLFVHENYLNVNPIAAKGNVKKALGLVSETADSLCLSDLVKKTIRSQNAWSLLPAQAIYASVLPGELMEGHFRAQINFPAWFGKNSRRGKMSRLIQELHAHMRLRISGGRQAVNLDYAEKLKEAIAEPLVNHGQEGIQETLNFLEEYSLLREDLESLAEITTWPGSHNPDPFSKVDSKVKASFTRAYNKSGRLNPFAMEGKKKTKRVPEFSSEDGMEEDEALEEEEDEEDEDLPPTIKVKGGRGGGKKPESQVKGRGGGKKSETGELKAGPSSSGEKSRGRGRGRGRMQ
ncbi:unnamed protein product [Darwinula stevensoni]|uniref:Replication factor C subunit 1 n=1 Tax=Darwinula stevensoni TaxID=69355 RepID=A0A7R8XAW6_9CRUS|nr:unnamed protein product [Darwinula stevensoni]CAG0892298.1 unnamed protein product [Darwinula stevensoni]